MKNPIDFGKFTKGDILKVIINIEGEPVLRKIEELNKERAKASKPLLPTTLDRYKEESDKENQVVHINWVNAALQPVEKKVISYYFVAENPSNDRIINPIPIFKGGFFKMGVHAYNFTSITPPGKPRFGKVQIRASRGGLFSLFQF